MAKILFVEDEQLILDYCCNIIAKIDPSIELFSTTTAEGALELLNKHKIEGAFIDIGLPGISGFELVRIMRERDDYHLLPIVFATGTNNNSTLTYKTYHNFDYISKPFDDEKIIIATKNLLTEIENQKRAVTKEKKKIIKVDSKGGISLIEVNNILFARKQVDKVIIIVENAPDYYYLRQSLESFSKYINDHRFLRCNKSAIVNVSKIKRIVQCSPKTWDLFFEANDTIKCELSYIYHEKILSAINERI